MQVLLLLWIAGVQFSTNFIKVHGNNIVIDCPAVRDGDVSTFGGTLYKANISSVCDLLVPTKMTFLLTYPSTVVEVLCEQQLSPCNTAENNQGCRCVSDGADAYTFEFNFRFNKSKHEGSTLSITTDCFRTIPYGLTSSDPCDLKEVLTVTLQQDFSFTCPSAWTDGAVENLKCVIPQAKFSAKPGGLCDIYTDSVLFQLTKADGTKITMCTVIGFDTACDGSVNADGCGCREISGGNIVIDYNITAVKADHDGARWECEPQCYDAAVILSVLSPPNTTECFNTIFVSVSPPTPDQAVTVAGKPGASSNGLSTAAAVGVMAAVMTVGVAATVIWMWRRQWILPCASNADSGESRGTPDEHHRPTPAGVLETGGQEDISLYDEIQHSSVQGDPPVPSGYEHLKMQDVGMRSVYSGLRPYPNRARC